MARLARLERAASCLEGRAGGVEKSMVSTAYMDRNESKRVKKDQAEPVRLRPRRAGKTVQSSEVPRLFQLMKNGKQIIARAEPKEQGMLVLFVDRINPGEDLFGVPYQQLFDAAPGLIEIDDERKVLNPVP